MLVQKSPVFSPGTSSVPLSPKDSLYGVSGWKKHKIHREKNSGNLVGATPMIHNHLRWRTPCTLAQNGPSTYTEYAVKSKSSLAI